MKFFNMKPTISIIIPVKNLQMITQVCFDSLKLYTKDYELIVIDDGSEQETKEFLEKYGCDVLIRNEESKGFPKAVNQGCEKARGEYIIILNNDVVVTPDWTKKMIAKFEMDKKLGILSCTTNRVEGFQHIEHNRKGVDYEYADALTGFCLMLKREVFDKLKEKDGYYFDERFGLGGQEDADMTYRVRQLGYEVGIARDVFIYHYGSASFREEFNHNNDYSHKYAQSRVDILRDKYKDGYPKNNIIQNNINAQIANVRGKKKLFIYVPNLGTIHPQLAKVLAEWYRIGHPEYEIFIDFPSGMLPLGNARSQCVKWFLEKSNDPDDRILFIDSDIIPPLDALNKLILHNKDVVGALCFMMKPNDNGTVVPVPVAMRYNENKEYVVYFDGKGLTEVDAIGGGCVMSTRRVFEKISEDGNNLYDFHYYPDGTLSLVGDFHYCQSCQKSGFKVFVDFDTICEHYKEIGLKSINNLLIEMQQGNV